jgi:hypothetical protein
MNCGWWPLARGLTARSMCQHPNEGINVEPLGPHLSRWPRRDLGRRRLLNFSDHAHLFGSRLLPLHGTLLCTGHHDHFVSDIGVYIHNTFIINLAIFQYFLNLQRQSLKLKMVLRI